MRLLVAIVASLVLAQAASASIWSGQAADPVGDSAGVASQDLVSAIARYDTAGELWVAAKVAGDVVADPVTSFRFSVAQDATACASDVYVSGNSDGSGGSYGTPLTDIRPSWGSNGGVPEISRSGEWIVFHVLPQSRNTEVGLRDRALRCLFVEVAKPLTNEDLWLGRNTVYDRLDVPVVMTLEAVDCPGRALKGRTLRAARAAIRRAGCDVGSVERPARKRGRLVVRRAWGSPTVNLALARQH